MVFEKGYIMRCSSSERITRNEMMPSRCRQVNWGKCGIPWVNCAVLCVKDDWKGQFWGLRYCLSKLHSLLSFSVMYDVTQYNRSVYLRVFKALHDCCRLISRWHCRANVLDKGAESRRRCTHRQRVGQPRKRQVLSCKASRPVLLPGCKAAGAWNLPLTSIYWRA